MSEYDDFDDFDEEGMPASALRQNKAEGQSPGEILRAARVAHDYSVEDLCAQTKLSRKTVRALEDDDFEALSQPVFARGYYRQCAKVLDIDSDRLMAAYTAWGGDTVARPVAPTSPVHVMSQDAAPHSRRFLGVTALVVLLLLAIAAVLVLVPKRTLTDDDKGTVGADNDGNTTIMLSSNGAPDASGDPGDPDDSAARAENTGQGMDSGHTIAQGGAPAVVGDNGNGAPPTGQASGGRNVNRTLGINSPAEDNAAPGNGAPGERASAPPVAPGHLKLVFSKRSWVSVTDANGNRLLTGIYDNGDSKEFDGTAPYKITLGFAPGVAVMIGGQPVDVAAQTTSNSTAHLTVRAPSADAAASDQ